MGPEVLEDERTSRMMMRYGSAILQDPSDPYYGIIKECFDVVNDDPPSVLPPDRSVRHEIDLVPGTKYFQVAALVSDVLRAQTQREVAHGARFQQLNAATVPASTPIPRKDVLQNNMAGCTVFSTLDMGDGYYQLLMRESDIPLTAVCTPSGMLWEWLAMPQGLSNAPATFNKLVTQLFWPMRHFVQTYFDDIFYANINICIFGAEEIPFLGCFLGKDGVRVNPEKVSAIAQLPVPTSQKDLRKLLGLANTLHKYSANYAKIARPHTNLLKKDALWSRATEAQQAFEVMKRSLQSAPILALPDKDGPFSVVCDASDFAIDCALLQADDEGRERVIAFQSR
ncbi:unnamed protein product [Phytophthora fragariaefolia]|uniref:Unnamed protein product n=1 Tax=Phytophthora fragariaefolia TaxID=1490495 RepID=A0A9W7CX56_9STRA|nr:unnamed protein product [Phytophthora fragariaefolia]